MTFQTQSLMMERPVFAEQPVAVPPGGSTFGSGSDDMIRDMEAFLAAQTGGIAGETAGLTADMDREFGDFQGLEGLGDNLAGFPGMTDEFQSGQGPFANSGYPGLLDGLNGQGQGLKNIQITGGNGSPENLEEDQNGNVYENGKIVGEDDEQHHKLTIYSSGQDVKQNLNSMRLGSGNLFEIGDETKTASNGDTTYDYGNDKLLDKHAGDLPQPSNYAMPGFENTSLAQNIPEGAQGKELTNVAAYNTFGGKPVTMKKDVQGNLYNSNGQLIGKADEHDHLTLYPSAQEEINQLTRNPLLHNDPGNPTNGILALGAWASKTPDGGVAFGNNIRIKDV